MSPEQIYAVYHYFFLAMGPLSLMILIVMFLISNNHKRKYFKSFVGVEPPMKKDKKMISFIQPRVDAVMTILARDIQRAIDYEENFLKSNEKDMFDKVIFETEKCKTTNQRYQNICHAISRTKEIFWKLHKIVKFYNFTTKNGFKDYISSSNEW